MLQCHNTDSQLTAINFKFTSNNVKSLQSSKNRLKVLEYLRNNIYLDVIPFLQETHSTFNNEVKWNNKFKSKTYNSHCNLNSRCVLIFFYGNKQVNAKHV